MTNVVEAKGTFFVIRHSSFVIRASIHDERPPSRAVLLCRAAWRRERSGAAYAIWHSAAGDQCADPATGGRTRRHALRAPSFLTHEGGAGALQLHHTVLWRAR